jgi:thiol:disulfide interchange protein
MSASFAVVSIASDLRYHLWSMIAAALALILMIDARALERRRAVIAASVVFALTVIASLGHIGLAPKIVPPHPAFIPPVAGAKS